MAVLKNSLIVSLWTSVSRMLGFARDLLIANKLGASMASDAFFIALILPNLLRRLFAEGAFNVAFVPILARHKGHTKAEALEFASATLSWLMLLVTLTVLAGELMMPGLVTLLAGGWVNEPEKFNLAVHLGRITFPYLGLIALAAFLGAVCNTFGQFAAYAMVPAFLNISILVCLFALPGMGAHPAEAAAWAIPLGGVGQALYMLWSVKKLGLKLKLVWLPKHKDLKPLLYRMGPAAIGVGILQLSLLVDNAVASWLPEGAITYLQYANRFYQLPLSLIGVAVATVLLPHLAVLLGEGNRKEATRAFTDALSACLALALGCCVGFTMMAPEMMQALLRHGELTQEASQLVAWAMIGYVLGLPGYILTKVTAPAFFAAEDPISPVKAGAWALGVNFALNVLFVVGAKALHLEHIAHVGIALSTAIGGYVNAALQWHWLNSRGVLDIDRAAFGRKVVKMLMVSGAIGVTLGLCKLVAPYNMEWNLIFRLAWLGVMGVIGVAVFAVGLEMTGLLNVRSLGKSMLGRKKKKLVAVTGADADNV
jgi:putative peptidoglycan lipid II flippase